MSSVPTIETPRLILRGWRDADVEHWVRMNAHPRVSEFLGQSFTPQLSEARAAVIRAQLERDGYGWWVAEIKSGQRFAGAIALREVPFEAAFSPAREIGWRFAFEHWGHGFATEGAAAALDFAFARLGWSEVVAFTAAVNLRSQRVTERLGMTHDPADDFDHPAFGPGHRLRPHLLYRIRGPIARSPR